MITVRTRSTAGTFKGFVGDAGVLLETEEGQQLSVGWEELSIGSRFKLLDEYPLPALQLYQTFSNKLAKEKRINDTSKY